MEENNVAQPQADEMQEINNTETTQETTQTTTEQTTPTQQSFKVKHLHEEKEVSFDEAPTYIQKGMDYDRVKGKYEESKPVLSFVEELAQESGMEVQEYLQRAREYREQERIRALAESEGISEELAQRLTTLEKREQEREQSQKAYETEQQKQQMYQEFFEYFAKENERSFDPAKDRIPDEVWTLVNSGKHLVDAFQMHEAKSLKAKIKEYEAKLQVQQTNEANNATSTGSVTGNGATNTDFISQELFNNKKHDGEWVRKNFDRINQSRKNW